MSKAYTYTVYDLRNGADIQLTAENDLLMIHSDLGNQQYPLDGIGIEMVGNGAGLKLGIWHVDGKTYQSLYIEGGFFDPLRDWFRGLGFAVPDTMNGAPRTRQVVIKGVIDGGKSDGIRARNETDQGDPQD